MHIPFLFALISALLLCLLLSIDQVSSLDTHFLICHTQSPAFDDGRIQVDDEIVLVNGLPVVATRLDYLFAEMNRKPRELTLVLKKSPTDESSAEIMVAANRRRGTADTIATSTSIRYSYI